MATEPCTLFLSSCTLHHRKSKKKCLPQISGILLHVQMWLSFYKNLLLVLRISVKCIFHTKSYFLIQMKTKLKVWITSFCRCKQNSLLQNPVCDSVAAAVLIWTSVKGVAPQGLEPLHHTFSFLDVQQTHNDIAGRHIHFSKGRVRPCQSEILTHVVNITAYANIDS